MPLFAFSSRVETGRRSTLPPSHSRLPVTTATFVLVFIVSVGYPMVAGALSITYLDASTWDINLKGSSDGSTIVLTDY